MSGTFGPVAPSQNIGGKSGGGPELHVCSCDSTRSPRHRVRLSWWCSAAPTGSWVFVCLSFCRAATVLHIGNAVQRPRVAEKARPVASHSGLRSVGQWGKRTVGMGAPMQ